MFLVANYPWDKPPIFPQSKFFSLVRKLVLSLALATIVGMSSDFQISVVKGFLKFHLPPLEMILDWYSFLFTSRISPPLWRWMCLWRLVCRGLTESIKLPVVGILYLSSGQFAFVLAGVLYFVRLLRLWSELCPVYLICRVDAQMMVAGRRTLMYDLHYIIQCTI